MNTLLYSLLAVTIDAGELGVPKVDANSSALQTGLNTVYLWAGIISVIVIIFAGFLYVISTGEPAKTKRAKDAILYAVIGLIVIMMAFVITNIVIGGTSQ